jgi:hypothetical protein
MPGPGNKKTKAKAKPKASGGNSNNASASTLTSDAFLDDIDKAEGWQQIVLTLCDAVRIPGTTPKKSSFKLLKLKLISLDLTTRHGLKRVHADFESIYKKLDRYYEKYPDNDKVKGLQS